MSTATGTAPVIAGFAASPTTVAAGQLVTLTWTVSGATSLSVSPGVGAVAGTSVRVVPSATTIYTLTATNNFGSRTATSTVIVGRVPAINLFMVYPMKAAAGSNVTLSWSVSGTQTVTIDHGVGSVSGTSVTVKPTATTTYTLTAANAVGSRTAAATVLVGSAPVIASFAANPAAVVTPKSATLSWSVSGATTLSIDNGVGAVAGNSRVVNPRATTSYTLTASNSFGSATARTTVTVGTAPVIAAFTAAPASITAGRSTTLSWNTTGAQTLTIDPGIGPVTGTSVSVTPALTTTYTLTATNSIGPATARVTVTVGNAPVIASYSALPASIAAGSTTKLSWSISGAQTVSIDNGVGVVGGTFFTVKPSVTTTYTLTAMNVFGSTTAAAIVTVTGLPAIASFTAAPAGVTAGICSTLAWTTARATTVSIDHGIGPVGGNSVSVCPAVSTTYTLTAANGAGATTATIAVTVGAVPLITNFWAFPNSAGPGISGTLRWQVSGATSLSIDHGIGTVTGTSVNVTPAATTIYTLTARNTVGSATATATVSYWPLVTVSSQLFYTEHAIFIIPDPNQVTWTGTNSWGSVYSAVNINSYVSKLKSLFPDDYFFVVITANNLTPNSVPNVLTYRRLASGIGENSITGVGVPNICRYHLGGGTVTEGAYGVLDHEIGHNWEVFIGTEVGTGHWLPNSTATGQMADTYSDDGYATVKQIAGDPVSGFSWAAVDNLLKNETETFSDQDLYLQGFGATFPDLYVLNSPVYNPDHTMSYASVNQYDQAWVVQKNGVRSPDYRTSPKRLRMGFIYIARNLAEVQTVYQPIERSINQFVNAEQIDTKIYRFQVPFLVDTRYRASVDALLKDLDGNATPVLTIPGPQYLTTTNGAVTVPFVAADANGAPPVVSCMPAASECTVTGNTVVVTGITPATHFYTIKAQDAGGKKTFAHFVVDAH